jgi:hypothetical protein
MNAIAYNISIQAPDKKPIQRLRLALRYAKAFQPRSFKTIIRNLKNVIVLGQRGLTNETFVEKRTWVTESSILNDRTTTPYVASLLLHEAKHIAQYRSRNSYRGARAEREAYRVQRAFLVRAKQYRAVQWLDSQYRSRWWAVMDRRIRSHERFARAINRIKWGHRQCGP